MSEFICLRNVQVSLFAVVLSTAYKRIVVFRDCWPFPGERLLYLV